MSYKICETLGTTADQIAHECPEECGYCHEVVRQSTYLAEAVIGLTMTVEEAIDALCAKIRAGCPTGRQDGDTEYTTVCGWQKPPSIDIS